MRKAFISRGFRVALLGFALLLNACGGTADTPAPVQPTPNAVSGITVAPTTDTAMVAATDTVAAPAATTAPKSSDDNASATPATGPAAVQETPTANPVEAQPTATGDNSMVADLGFRPDVNGFKFENYGGDTGRTNLTADDLRRMFGDQVCGSMANSKCILTPPAQEWMSQVNQGMSGGHCEGFAALSLAFYTHKEDPAKYGAVRTYDLSIDGNEALQRDIAYYFATQATQPTSAGEVKGKTPNDILDMLVADFKEGPQTKETYTMGIYQPGFKGGHAITPYAVQDKGDGRFLVMVYDNNYPGLARSVEFDRNANTWVYSASTNPNEPSSLYKGDADTQTLTITPTSPRLQQQVCPFCEVRTSYGPGAKLQAPAIEYNQLWLDGDGHLLITDKDGKRTGVVDGNLVNEIPGVYFQTIRSADLWKDSEEPIYFVPTGMQFTLTLDGGGLQKQSDSSVTLLGPGYDLSVDNIGLDPGQKDTIDFSSDGKTVTYKTDYNESPDISLGVETTGADYSFVTKGVDIESGAAMTLGIDVAKGNLSLSSKGNKANGTYSLVMDRIDDAGEQVFGHDSIELEPNATAILEYGKWQGDGTEVPLGIDKGSDGFIDDTLSLTDVK